MLLKSRTEVIEGITIRGGADFRRRTKEALALLKSAGLLALMGRYIAIIREGKRSGMKTWLERPTYTVGKATWSHSPLWYAGTIAHDSYHSRLYEEAKARNGGRRPALASWAGEEAERECLSFQRRILEQLSADKETIAYLQAWEQNPSYAGHQEGWRGYRDYLRRWW